MGQQNLQVTAAPIMLAADIDKKEDGIGQDPNIRRVNIDYFYILLPYLKQYNSACGLCVQNRRFGKKMVNATDLLIHV